MFKWLTNGLERRPRLRRRLILGASIAVFLFSLWCFWSYWATARFRDDLIARRYEGSLSENLGFQAVLTSEASRKLDFQTAAEQQRAARIRAALTRATRRLETLRPVPSRAASAARSLPLESMTNEPALLRLLTSPALDGLPLSALGLAQGTQEHLEPYPFLYTLRGQANASFVFIPAALVNAGDALLAPRIRRELVFSKIAERDLRDLLVGLAGDGVYQAYYISCADFIRLVDALPDNRGRPEFSPLKSFADRTYFRETRRAPSHLRQSEPYIDVTGGGLINTYSAFLNNDAFGLCGMIGVDRQLLRSFWGHVDLGAASGPLHDFAFGTYSLSDRKLTGGFSQGFRALLKTEIEAREADVKSEIQRIEVDGAKVFTVPRGEGKIAFFVFDPVSTDRKYTALLVGGMIAFALFVAMVWLDSWVQRYAEAAKQSQSEIEANLQGGFVVVDDKDRIISTNDRFLAMVDEAARGNLITQYLAPESGTEYLQLKSRGGFEFAGRVRSRDGTLSPVIITSALLSYDGQRNRRMLILIDSATLEQTIAGKFLNIFSHALKSPVHGMLLVADLFRRKNALPKFDRYFSIMQRKVLEFSTLTDNVLRFSALEVKELSIHRSPVNVAKVLRMVLSATREGAKAQQLYLQEDISGNLRTQTDAELLQVVLNNLIDNALKYTPRGGITVRAHDLLTSIRIVVADTGPGVPITEREDVFKLFFQGTRPGANSREGLGLGLYISKRYIEALGGSLVYEPILGEGTQPGEAEVLKGSRFIVDLPRQGGGRPDEQEDQDSAA